MQILDQAVAVIRQQGAKGNVQGAPLAAKLEAIAACGEQAARLWQGYLDNPGAAGDKYTIVSWIGAERAKQLHELSLQVHELVSAVCAAAGDQARFLVLDESPIVLAYRGLKEGETGPQAAQVSIAQQQEHIKHLRALADQVRTLKPGARAAIKPAAKKKTPPQKKAAAKKPAAKKTVKKAAKKK
jgi:hypothetical protein